MPATKGTNAYKFVSKNDKEAPRQDESIELRETARRQIQRRQYNVCMGKKNFKQKKHEI